MRALLFLLLLLLTGPVEAAITLVGTAKYPTTENGTGAGATGPTATVTPPTFASGDVVTVFVCYEGTSVTITTSVTGGQTWSNATQVVGTLDTCNMFWCVLSGSWGANPAWTVTTGSNAMTAYMAVWRGVDTTTPFDISPAGVTYASTSAVANVGPTTTAANSVVAFWWQSQDNNQYSAATGVTLTQAETQWRNAGGGGTGISVVMGYTAALASPGASGTATATQTSLNPDAGQTWDFALLISGGTPAAPKGRKPAFQL